MAVRIILKNSATEDKRPSAAQLENGEIALNYNAAGAFLTCEDTDGNIQQVGGVKISEVAPDSPVKQTLWFQPSSLTLFVYDGNSFLPVAGGGGGGTPGGGITTIIGNNGIDASEIAGVVTLDVELHGGDDGLEFRDSKLKASVASASQLGSVKIGDGIDVDSTGTISVDVPQALNFRGSVDLNNAPTGQISPNPPQVGDTYVNSALANPVDNGWTGIGGEVSQAGDLVVWDGSEWEIIGTGGTPDVDLGYTAAPNNGTVTNTGGNDADIPLAIASDSNATPATAGFAGLFSGAEKEKLAGIEDGANVGMTSVALGYTAKQTEGEVTNDAGANATIPGAVASDSINGTPGVAGLFTGEEKEKLAGIATGANVGLTGVALGYTPAVDQGTVTNDAGANATIPGAVAADSINGTAGLAGLFTGEEKEKLAGLNDNATNDGRYLRIDDNGGTEFDQTVASTGTTTFSGLTTHGGGIEVTGGLTSTINNGLFFNSGINLQSNEEIKIMSFSENVSINATDGNVVIQSVNTDSTKPVKSFSLLNDGRFVLGIASNPGYALNFDPEPSSAASGVNIENKVASSATFCIGLNVAPDSSKPKDGLNFLRYVQAGNTGKYTGSKGEIAAYFAHRNTANAGANAYGFYSELFSTVGAATNKYNFYAEGDAPNFFAGDTYIGGSTSTTTRELWESTLTEEQKEQLAAGTLVVPANVAIPGDGEFARQWWYDQQDEETQALIDAGEFDYPEQFAAANFVDTFELGVTTNINLSSTGLGEFKGGVNVTGGKVSIGPDVADTRTHVLIGGASSLGGTNIAAIRVEEIYNRASSGGINGANTAFLALPKQTVLAAEWNTHFRAIGVSPDGVTVDNVAGFFADATLAAAGDTSYGFYSNIFSGDDGDFNFYAGGTSPNYFEGTCTSPSFFRTTQGIICQDVSDPNGNDWTINPLSSSTVGFVIRNDGTFLANLGSPSSVNTCASYRRDNDGKIMGFRNSSNTEIGNIRIEGGAIAGPGLSDYRTKSSIAALPSATAQISALNPVSFEYNHSPGYTHTGFIAHELEDYVPEAVFGTKDEEEAIGTLVDYDGTILETEVTEPEELEYIANVTDEDGVTTQELRIRRWTQTGTRPLYQGVDQTKLIPLLTKALQEALERIETLEALIN